MGQGNLFLLSFLSLRSFFGTIVEFYRYTLSVHYYASVVLDVTFRNEKRSMTKNSVTL